MVATEAMLWSRVESACFSPRKWGLMVATYDWRHSNLALYACFSPRKWGLMVATILSLRIQTRQALFQSPKMRINGCNLMMNAIAPPIAEFQSPKMRINGCNITSNNNYRDSYKGRFQSPKMRINGCNNSWYCFGLCQDGGFQSPKMRINGCNNRSPWLMSLPKCGWMFQSPKMRINGCNRSWLINLKSRVGFRWVVSVPENED